MKEVVEAPELKARHPKAHQAKVSPRALKSQRRRSNNRTLMTFLFNMRMKIKK